MRSRSQLANDAWESLLTAHAALLRQFATDGIWADLSMREYDVLYTLSKCQEPLRVGELPRFVLLSQPALSRLVDRLVERGLVRRSPDPADGRAVRVALTAAGRRAQREVGLRHGLSVARTLKAGLTVEELRQLETLCHKLASSADPTTQHDEDVSR
jgi:DNA-binding MarR family transcriptional regulator